MSKSTLALIAIATLFLGALIGAAVVKSGDTGSDGEAVPAAVPAARTGSTSGIRYLAPDDVELEYDEFGRALPFMIGNNFFGADKVWRTETVTIEIEGDAAVEYKALMDQGDSLSFHWSVDGGQAYYDMHAHDAAFGDEFFTRYAEGEGAQAGGTIVAPYKGEHGWYWLNLEADTITISLQVAGFYD